MNLEEFEFYKRSRTGTEGYVFDASDKGHLITIIAYHVPTGIWSATSVKFRMIIHDINWLYDTDGDLIDCWGTIPPAHWENFHNFFADLCAYLDTGKIDQLISVMVSLPSP